MSLPALQPDPSAVLASNGVGHRQAETGALANFLGREERIEHLCLSILRNARAVVIDLQQRRSAISIVDGPHDYGAAAVGREARLLGIDDQIQQHLLDLMPVYEHLR